MTAPIESTVALGPLRGLRVLEFGHVAAGPFAGMLLGDLGADVVKIEPPVGDQLRSWPPIERQPDGSAFSHNFASLNRNKRSVSLNLKDPLDLAKARALVTEADVIIENYRPGVLEKLGLGFEASSKCHKGLIYCSISGFGIKQEGKQRGAYDVVVQAMSGLMSVTGSLESGPIKAGVPVGDFVAGLYASLTILANVPLIRDSGRAVHLDCPMNDCLLGISALQTSEYWGTGKAPQRWGTAHPRNAPYAACQASDKLFVVAAGNDNLWQRVANVVGQPEMALNPDYLTQELRAKNQVALYAELAPIFMQRTSEEWLQLFEEANVPCSPVNDYADVLEGMKSSGDSLLMDIEVPVIGNTPMVAYPVTDSHGHLAARLPPPSHGAHTQEVLDEWATQR